MRKIYLDKNIRTTLTQGSIISHCISFNYYDCEVFGCVITPRCDLENGLKVPTVHYLPIVTFKDWYLEFGIQRLLQIYKSESKGRLNDRINSYLKIQNISEYKLPPEEIKELILKRAKGKKQEELMQLLKQYTIDMALEKEIYKPTDKDKKKLVKDLLEHRLAGYYPIEDWGSADNYKSYRVIILREIQSFKREIALKFKSGFLEEEFDQSFLSENAFAVSSNRSNIYEIVSEIASPYIEHIMQAFSHNFCRIGVEDMQDDITNNLIGII